MSQDPSMNTAILHWATQVAGSANANTTAPQDNNNSNNSAQQTAAVAPSGPQALLALPNEATTTPANTAGTSPGAAVPAGRVAGDYTWLREALASVESPERKVKRLLQLIEELSGVPVHPDFVCKPNEHADADEAANADADPEERLVAALEELSDMVEDINWATEFGLMQGPARTLKVLARALEPTPPLASGSEDDHVNLVAESADVRRCLALTVAHSAQLHDGIQAAYAEHKWESVLLPSLARECRRSRASSVVAAVLHACSCLCRDNTANTLVFVQAGGVACLTDILRFEAGRESASPKVLARTLFFLSYLAQAGVSSEEALGLACAQIEVGPSAASNAASDEKSDNTTTSTITTSKATVVTTTTTTTTGSSEESVTPAPAHSDNAEVQRAAALFLLNAFRKAPEAVKKAVREFMPRRWEQWKSEMQHDDDHDYRAELVDAVEKAG